MTFSLYVTLFGAAMLTLIIIWNTNYYRNKITVMTGMMISMVLGMSIGLTIGVIAGVLLSGNLFYSTILAMIIGIAAGFLAGLPISLMAVLDGILAGIMGGMMGAMLGEMISPEFQDSIIRLMFLLFVGIIMILFRMMKQEFNNDKTFIGHPFVLVILYILLIISYNQLDPLIDISQPDSNSHQHNMNTDNIVIQANDYSFSPSQVEVKAGDLVTITLDNIGKAEHDIEIIGMEAVIEEQSSLHDHAQNNNQIHVHSYPGEKQHISFTPITPGTYRYVCTIPGHIEAGMTGVFEVVS